MKSGFGAGSLILEMTESVLVQDAETATRRLHALRALGVRRFAFEVCGLPHVVSLVRPENVPSVAVAKKFLRIITGDFPPDWRSDPAAVTYWQGWGSPEESVLAACAAIIARHGASALGIAHNPSLEREILSRIGDSPYR